MTSSEKQSPGVSCSPVPMEGAWPPRLVLLHHDAAEGGAGNEAQSGLSPARQPTPADHRLPAPGCEHHAGFPTASPYTH